MGMDITGVVAAVCMSADKCLMPRKICFGIVVKDLSRFGRDYIETGNYLETIFPMLHIRFIIRLLFIFDYLYQMEI